MMDAAAVRIGLGQNDPVARHLVDGPDVLVVAAGDFHMLADSSEQVALTQPALAPGAEVVFEVQLMLAPIFVIILVEIAHVAVAPASVVRIEVALAPAGIARTRIAGPAILVLAPRRLRPVIARTGGALVAPIVVAAIAAGSEELVGFGSFTIVTGHRAIAALSVAIPFAFTIPAPLTVALQFAAPPWIVIAFAKAAAFIHAARFVPVASVLASIAIVIAIPVAPKSPIIISVSIAAAPAALALGALLVLAAAPLGIFVAEPGGDLIARSVPEAAVVLPPALARVIALRE